MNTGYAPHVLPHFSPTGEDCYPRCRASACFIIRLLFLKPRFGLEAGDRGPPVDMPLLAQLLIDIERAAGEERAGPLLANLCFNQRV